jgi:hypothetical protein
VELAPEAAHNPQHYKRRPLQSQEITMLNVSPSPKAPTIRFEFLNWVATDALPRDRTPSHRLHEPSFRTSTTDPMTGILISDVSGHPSVVDGDLTIYFETEATRKAYLDLPVDHPNLRLPYPGTDGDDRGG